LGWRERQGYAGGERSINSDIIEETFAAAAAYVMAATNLCFRTTYEN